MKKTLALILALCMVFSLCACGAKEEAAPAAPAAPAEGAAEAPVAAVTFTVTADVTGARAPYVERFAELVAEKTEGRSHCSCFPGQCS